MADEQGKTPSEAGLVQRASKQPRFAEETTKPNQFSDWSGGLDWVYREHLVEPTFQVDTREYDSWLLDFANGEPHLAGILSSVVSKDKNRAWQLVGGKRQVAVFGDRLRNVEGGAGWRHFISLQSRAYYNTNIGAITEVETVTGNAGDPMLSLYHVDSTRVKLTGRADTPLRYYPPKGKMQTWQPFDYFRTVSNPDVREDWRGVGFCAVNRCLSLTKMMIAVYEHDLEQLGAEPPKGFLVGEGVTQKVYEDAKRLRQEARRNGQSSFSIDVLALLPQQEIGKTNVQFIPYSNLPTNISNLAELTYLLMLGYSLCFGYDPQEFYPVQGGSFGQDAQANIQSEKATYKGEADFSLEHQNHIQNTLPPTLLFEYDRNDTRGDLAEIQAQAAYIDSVNTVYAQQSHLEPVITAEQYRYLLAEKGFIPNEWTESTEEIELTSDTERARRAYRDNEQVVRSAERFPNDPVQLMRYNPANNRTTVRTLWNSGQDLRSWHKRWAGFTRRDNGDGTLSISPKKAQPRQYKDPYLSAVLHGGDCDCDNCSTANQWERGNARARIIREAQEGAIVWQSTDGEVTITTGDIDLAIAEAQDNTVLYDMLTATLMLSQRHIVREFTWDANAYRYRRPNGQFVSQATVRAAIRQSVESNAPFIDSIAGQLANGSVTPFDAMQQIREELKREYIRLGVAGRGGRDAMLRDDWLVIGRQLRGQYQYLSGFMSDIEGGNLTEAQIQTRLEMYFESAQQAYEAMNAMARGLDPRKLPALPSDGSTKCLTRCKCYWEFQEIFRDGKLVGFKCFWRRTVAESCETCVDRAKEWNPLEIMLGD